MDKLPAHPIIPRSSVIRSLVITILVSALSLSIAATAYSQNQESTAEAEQTAKQCADLYRAARYDEALEPCRHIVELREKGFSHDRPELLISALGLLGSVYRAKRNFADAESTYLRAVAITEKEFGREHEYIAIELNELGSLYQAQGDIAKAEASYQRALFIREKVRGSEHLDVAQSLNSLANLYTEKGDYAKAEPLYQRALAIREKVLGAEHPLVATSLNNLASLYQDRGEYTKVEPLYVRALAIREKALGAEHPLVATSLNNLASLYNDMGEFARAEPLYQRALIILEKTFGEKHLEVANLLNSVGTFYEDQGDLTKAEPLLNRALAIYERDLGREHPDVAFVLTNLASLFQNKGDYSRAEAFFQRALAIREKALGREHPLVAKSLNFLGALYKARTDYAKAKPLYERALAIREKALGVEHPDFAESLNNLALLYREKGDYTEAEPLFQRAISIFEKALGKDHPGVAVILNNLGLSYQDRGEYAKAEAVLQRALMIYEKALGNKHPVFAIMLSNMAILYEAQDDHPRAIEFFSRSQEVREVNINSTLVAGSEKQKQLYLDTLARETDQIVSLNTNTAPSNKQAARLALTTILRRKGRALDVMTDQIASLRHRASSDDAALLGQLATAQSQLATLQLSNETRLTPEKRHARVVELETEIEKLQTEIGRRSTEFGARTRLVTLDTVRLAIPRDAALVEIFSYRPYDAKAAFGKRFASPRYVAYVLNSNEDSLQYADLGEAAPIDASLKLWREALLDPSRNDTKKLGRQVDEQVMRPIRKLLGNTKRLFISPDGALNLIPFAALVDENDKYLLETYDLNYLTSGRDLLRLQAQGENRSGAVIFANPTYNLTGQQIAACQGQSRSRGLALTPSVENGAGTNGDTKFSGIDFAQICYPVLRGTAEEARLINGVLPGATVLTEKQATEAALKQLKGPAVLHVATHGFFLPDETKSANANMTVPDRIVTGENPLLRSGLIMAGANQRLSGAGEDGVLTAAEVAGLSLWGTKLVVLSACETGLGDVVNGAGVYGLRRALVLAGSETQVMSLWQVDDDATRDLMSDYYARLEKGEGRSEAMRSAQLAMLRGAVKSSKKPTSPTQARSHPYYWAPFISSGDWRRLDGKDH